MGEVTWVESFTGWGAPSFQGRWDGVSWAGRIREKDSQRERPPARSGLVRRTCVSPVSHGNERVRIEDRFGETRVLPLLPTTSGCLDGFPGPRWLEGSGPGPRP